MAITKKIVKKTDTGPSGGGKIIKKYLPQLYKCNDNKTRKAFRIKGSGSSVYVMYKGKPKKASQIPKNKKK